MSILEFLMKQKAEFEVEQNRNWKYLLSEVQNRDVTRSRIFMDQIKDTESKIKGIDILFGHAILEGLI